MSVASWAMATSVLTSLFGHKAWANRELFALLGTLPDTLNEQRHTCIRTLNHIYVVDRLFQARLAGTPDPFDRTNTDATPTLEALRSEVEATDAWYEDYVKTLAPAQRSEVLEFTFTDGDAGRMSREEILLHVITHGGYHRGNVGQVLKSVDIAPPRDLYTKFLHLSEGRRAA